MIFYFTGTGNSLYAANAIAEAQGDRVFSIAALMDQQKDVYQYELGENELLGFVFPIYAWGPPKMVLDFIRKLDVTGNPYAFSLNTCGNDEGSTSKMIRKALARKGQALDSAFSLQMPNNYLLGFDVDPKEVETEKLKAAELLLSEINKTISKRQKNINLTIPGRFPILKTALVNPMFNRFALNTRSFSADDTCTQCGICEKICPVHTIKVTDKPTWGKACTQCMGCINRCPVQAIQYGKGTAQKGRYYHPDLVRLEKQVKEL
jgi:NAD-dependent dihydropyrimidine dehydrogenase PreA subunit/flavodoxin